MNRLLLFLSLAIATTCWAAQPAATGPVTTATPDNAVGTPSETRTVKTKHQVIAEITGIIDKLNEVERTLDPSIIESYYPDKLVSILNGRLMHPPKASLLMEVKRMKQAHDYRVLNLEKPFIGISDDSTMAWAAVQQRKQELDRNTGDKLRSWEYATLMVFRQTPDGNWELVSRARSDSGD